MNVTVWFEPVTISLLVENPWVISVVNVPASSVVKTKLGVVSFPGVVIAVTFVKVGAVLSTVKVAPLVGADVIVLPASSVPFDKAIVDVPSPLGTV